MTALAIQLVDEAMRRVYTATCLDWPQVALLGLVLAFFGAAWRLRRTPSRTARTE